MIYTVATSNNGKVDPIPLLDHMFKELAEWLIILKPYKYIFHVAIILRNQKNVKLTLNMKYHGFAMPYGPGRIVSMYNPRIEYRMLLKTNNSIITPIDIMLSPPRNRLVHDNIFTTKKIFH